MLMSYRAERRELGQGKYGPDVGPDSQAEVHQDLPFSMAQQFFMLIVKTSSESSSKSKIRIHPNITG